MHGDVAPGTFAAEGAPLGPRKRLYEHEWCDRGVRSASRTRHGPCFTAVMCSELCSGYLGKAQSSSACYTELNQQKLKTKRPSEMRLFQFRESEQEVCQPDGAALNQ